MKLFDWIYKSRGVKRTAAAVALMLAQAPLPFLAPYQPLFLQIATVLGAAGLINTVVPPK